MLLVALVQNQKIEMALAAILDFPVDMTSQRQTNARIGILVFDSPEKMSLNVYIGALVKNLIFQDGAGGHFGFWPLEKIPNIFARDMQAIFPLNGP